MKNFRLQTVVFSLILSAGAHASAYDEVQPVTNAGSRVGALATASQPVVGDFDFFRADASTYEPQRRLSHVPEPEGWAMMLMGLGFVIYQIRRRKQARKPWDLR